MPKPGLLVIDKPTGPTSHDIVNIVRRGTQIRKVGHTGTLDPYASGVLLVLLGSVTRLAEYLLEVDKEYLATIRFGTATSTYDAAGRVTATRPFAPSLSCDIPNFLPNNPKDIGDSRLKGGGLYGGRLKNQALIFRSTRPEAPGTGSG